MHESHAIGAISGWREDETAVCTLASEESPDRADLTNAVVVLATLKLEVGDLAVELSKSVDEAAECELGGRAPAWKFLYSQTAPIPRSVS